MLLYVIAEIDEENMKGEVVAAFQREKDVMDYLHKQPKEKSFRIYVKDLETG